VPLVEELRQAWLDFESGDDRVAILHGDGRAFSVGADLNDNPLDLWSAVPGLGVQVSKPIIAAVHGHCIGGAYVLAMHSDLVVVEEGTKFSYPEVNVGFTGGIAAGLAARIPVKVATEFLLLAQPMDATRAYEVGMVNRVVPQGDSVKIAEEWATMLRDAAPLVVATLKKFMADTVPSSPSELAAVARRELVPIHTSVDRREGEAAFREKRVPRFVGR